ncbi:hypothetical protein EDD27_4446 [Nonomuraea polychroma]|uniref:Uncharacterized protein n=1 Tax=Nonomuraea polychroma TaxID=46176 RepID=A0A438M810_9ACTN|nr:hypothetical protein EDD27_4446 [Nonomuraea polychroma]
MSESVPGLVVLGTALTRWIWHWNGALLSVKRREPSRILVLEGCVFLGALAAALTNRQCRVTKHHAQGNHAVAVRTGSVLARSAVEAGRLQSSTRCQYQRDHILLLAGLHIGRTPRNVDES